MSGGLYTCAAMKLHSPKSKVTGSTREDELRKELGPQVTRQSREICSRFRDYSWLFAGFFFPELQICPQGPPGPQGTQSCHGTAHRHRTEIKDEPIPPR